MRSVTLTSICVSAVLAWCSQVRAYVLLNPDNTDVGAYIHEYQHRLASLVQFLEKINTLTQDTSRPEMMSPNDASNHRGQSGYKDIGRLIQMLEEPRGLDIEKKDYAILPPASEWCRLMGFRGCRGNSA